jgi:5'-nucleotidase
MAIILVTNDDGVSSPGLLALSHALAGLGELLVLAPEQNWSASGHAKTMHKPLRVSKVNLADGLQAHTSSGSPTDCVALAMGGVLGTIPDIVVSGINSGYNLGADITYSGTVACAMEATIKGVPGIAVSTDFYDGEDNSSADGLALTGQIAATITAEVLKRGLPARTLLNVNVPAGHPGGPRGMRITQMGNRHYPVGELVERHDPWGRPYYWLGGAGPVDDARSGTDISAVSDGHTSITPISLDMTDYDFLQTLAEWKLEAPNS